eukprot:CAMPEP_0182614506 /NCGR_PEP_ID=MMETSP1330-20130603/30738_1 /TAXON_ID=464278 /ORGANISM="Picochlorum sp., Strain RCC944" /LENGTH=126 /DNA_ID=CAMNT_0024834323 /DNA_START=400 /DNA_END=778 /DNA_ORIENTATION=+
MYCTFFVAYAEYRLRISASAVGGSTLPWWNGWQHCENSFRDPQGHVFFSVVGARAAPNPPPLFAEDWFFPDFFLPASTPPGSLHGVGDFGKSPTPLSGLARTMRNASCRIRFYAVCEHAHQPMSPS